jgi:diacylglycerol kinase (ATP)
MSINNLYAKLELDDNPVELPHLESIVIQNIPFWGAGVEPWTLGTDTNSSITSSFSQLSPTPRQFIAKQLINDGLLEVFGIYSSFHIAQLQVGLAEPYRIGQAKKVKIKLKKRFPAQIDGEPYEQAPCCIEIIQHNQAIMLEKQESTE